MARLMLVSRSWPSHERSGVSLAAAAHAQALVSGGHQVMIVGSDPSITLSTQLRAHAAEHVAASGSGALYAPARLDRARARHLLQSWQPDLLITEAWQTALTDGFIDLAAQSSTKALMVSHGVSIAPFSAAALDRLRSLGWLQYARRALPRRIRSLTAITTLDLRSKSARFADRDIAVALAKPVFELGNAPVNYSTAGPGWTARSPVVLVIGYFSPVKNQLAAIELMRHLEQSPLKLRFIGPQSGAYYERCRKRVRELRLEARVAFVEDSQTDIGQEISQCLAVVSTSVTEALPITLIEAMASTTPFVATAVGAVPSLAGGLCGPADESMAAQILQLLHDQPLWERCAAAGFAGYQARFSRGRVDEQLMSAVQYCLTNKNTAP